MHRRGNQASTVPNRRESSRVPGRSPDGELTESTSTVAHFELTETDAGTLLTVVETGFELLDGSQQTSSEGNLQGWAEELGKLKTFLESVPA